MLEIENLMFSLNLIKEKSLLRFQILLREMEIEDLKEEDEEIIKDIGQLLVRQERFLIYGEEDRDK
jgi:hypothetical protein